MLNEFQKKKLKTIKTREHRAECICSYNCVNEWKKKKNQNKSEKK